MAVTNDIAGLVRRFSEHYESYEFSTSDETQVRREFADPLFELLGWDIDTAGYAEAFEAVVHEDTLNIGASTKAPDDSFRMGGTRIFFVETKKPPVNLAKDPAPAYQLRRSRWSAKPSLCVLTDFQEFAVHDCRVQPRKTDEASTARVQPMCGIRGFVGIDDPCLVERMPASLYHRGPDDGGTLVEGAVALGHRRLGIIDLAGGRQPMSTRTASS